VPGVMPREYEGGRGQPGLGEADMAGGFDDAAMERRASNMTANPDAPAPSAAFRVEGRRALKDIARITSEDLAGYAAQSQAKAIEAGEVFQFELDHPVTVERQRSAMLPILASGIDGRRVSIFNPSDGSSHPMRGLEVTNSTGLQLMPGPISVYDSGSYAGDAQIGHVPAGDKRLLAYAVDLDVTFTRDDNSTEAIRKVRIVQGALEMTWLHETKTAYTFTNKDKKRPRTLIIEQQRHAGWTLTQPEKPYETTDDLYRFELPMEAGKQGTIAVVQQRTDSRSLAITSMDLPTLLAYSRQGQVSDKVIESFKQAAAKQARINDIERQIAALEKQRAEIDTDQSRIRQNMNTIDHSSDLYKRYMQKLTAQETKVEELAGAIVQAQGELETARAELNGYIANLNVE